MLSFFAISQGQELLEHSTPHHAMVQSLEGELEFTINVYCVEARRLYHYGT